MLRLVFAQRQASVADLLTYLDARRPDLPGNMSRATLLDNHDMQRLLWLARGDTRRLTLAAVCHLTLEGTPIIYYGTEVGLSQAADALHENAHARPPMIWDDRQDRTLLAHYQRLIALRRAHPALQRGQHTRLPCAPRSVSDPVNLQQAEQVGAYLRQRDDDLVLIALNNSDQPVSVAVSLAACTNLRGRPLRDLLAHQDAPPIPTTDGAASLDLPAMGFAVLAPA
jgi:cyclomaltodextrinase